MDGSVSFRAISIDISVSFGDTVFCSDISALIAVSRLGLNALIAVSRSEITPLVSVSRSEINALITIGHVQGMSDHHHHHH